MGVSGHVKFGESIEEAVSREIMEESGIKVKNVKYYASQPWPFPWSLMIGWHAEAETEEINTSISNDFAYFMHPEIKKRFFRLQLQFIFTWI